jgi:hypothetical protein
MAYRVPTPLGCLAFLAALMTGIMSTVATLGGGGSPSVALAGFGIIALMLMLHRFVGGLWVSLVAVFGLITVLIFTSLVFIITAAAALTTANAVRSDAANALLPGVLIALAVPGAIFGVAGFIVIFYRKDFVPEPVGMTPYSGSGPLTPGTVAQQTVSDYSQRAAARIEQAMPLVKVSVDKETLILYRAGVAWGVGWALPQAGPHTIQELVKWKDESNVGTAVLVCPSFDAAVKQAAKSMDVKLLTLP